MSRNTPYIHQMVKKDQKKVAAAAAAASKQDPDSITKKPVSHSVNDVFGAVNATYHEYLKSLTPRLKLIDSFLAFLVALGILQFIYVLLIGNFPFNGFLGGFIACVGQFVLTVSLRFHYASADAAKKTSYISPFAKITPEAAFGEYTFASLILHFIVFHFIN